MIVKQFECQANSLETQSPQKILLGFLFTCAPSEFQLQNEYTDHTLSVRRSGGKRRTTCPRKPWNPKKIKLLTPRQWLLLNIRMKLVLEITWTCQILARSNNSILLSAEDFVTVLEHLKPAHSSTLAEHRCLNDTLCYTKFTSASFVLLCVPNALQYYVLYLKRHLFELISLTFSVFDLAFL